MKPLDRYLAELARLGGLVSAAEGIVATGSEPLWRGASGFRVGGEPLQPALGARFDAASLTKPWMATLALVLDARGELPLEAALGEIAGTPVEGRLAGRTLEDLLRHRAGVRAWTPLTLRLGRRLGDRSALRDLVLAEPLDPGGRSTYSDLGYLLWGVLAEQRTGRSLADLLDALVCEPLGLAPLGALAADPPDAVECRLDNGREGDLAAAQGLRLEPRRSFHGGRPQDGNARALGYLGAHAGLFVTADEQLALAREWLAPGRLLEAGRVARALAGEGSHALGWARAAAAASAPRGLSARSFGHSGFTGGSLWIDPERGRIQILLAHRLSSRMDFDPFRREFHRLAAELDSPDPGPRAGSPLGESPTRRQKLH